MQQHVCERFTQIPASLDSKAILLRKIANALHLQYNQISCHAVFTAAFDMNSLETET